MQNVATRHGDCTALVRTFALIWAIVLPSMASAGDAKFGVQLHGADDLWKYVCPTKFTGSQFSVLYGFRPVQDGEFVENEQYEDSEFHPLREAEACFLDGKRGEKWVQRDRGKKWHALLLVQKTFATHVNGQSEAIYSTLLFRLDKGGPLLPSHEKPLRAVEAPVKAGTVIVLPGDVEREVTKREVTKRSAPMVRILHVGAQEQTRKPRIEKVRRVEVNFNKYWVK